MTNQIKYTLRSIILLTFLSQAYAEDKWTVGVVTLVTDETKWSLAVLPWISYRGDRFTIDPMKAAFIGQNNSVQWETGIGLDYNELFGDTERSVLAQIDKTVFAGPVRFALSASNRFVDPQKAWKVSGAMGSQFPFGKGLLGAELGLHSESTNGMMKLNEAAQHSARQ